MFKFPAGCAMAAVCSNIHMSNHSDKANTHPLCASVYVHNILEINILFIEFEQTKAVAYLFTLTALDLVSFYGKHRLESNVLSVGPERGELL